jgi:hypothetical protein
LFFSIFKFIKKTYINGTRQFFHVEDERVVDQRGDEEAERHRHRVPDERPRVEEVEVVVAARLLLHRVEAVLNVVFYGFIDFFYRFY